MARLYSRGELRAAPGRQQHPEGAEGRRRPAAFVTSGLRYAEEHGDTAMGTSKGHRAMTWGP